MAQTSASLGFRGSDQGASRRPPRLLTCRSKKAVRAFSEVSGQAPWAPHALPPTPRLPGAAARRTHSERRHTVSSSAFGSLTGACGGAWPVLVASHGPDTMEARKHWTPDPGGLKGSPPGKDTAYDARNIHPCSPCTLRQPPGPSCLFIQGHWAPWALTSVGCGWTLERVPVRSRELAATTVKGS